MDQNLHTTIDYKKLIELQSKEMISKLENPKEVNNKVHSSSKSKVKSIRRRNS